VTKAEKERYDAIARIGCIVCRHEGYNSPACVHHLTGLMYRATGKKANYEHSIPLCYEHHQGRTGIHTIGTKAWEAQYGTQEDLLAEVNEIIGEG
jgi:Recombination enhancement, RecA-dependent nuclease